MFKNWYIVLVVLIAFTSCRDYSTYVIDMEQPMQTIDGIGTSLTESSAFVLACLTPEQREQILRDLFSEDGANFSLVRTHIGSSDFSVEGCYPFSLAHDSMGFAKTQYPQIQNEHYGLYQLMADVRRIKSAQPDSIYRIVAAAWTAPDWMKDNHQYYDPKARYGGKLLPQYYNEYARYLADYIHTYRVLGYPMWAITPVNEPLGNDGSWESMHLSPQEQTTFIAHSLAPVLRQQGLEDVLIFGFDQNIPEVAPYAEAIYGDSLAYDATNGLALHWYASTVSCFPNILDSLHRLYPDKRLIHTEGCIDNLGLPGWTGVSDYEGYQETDWWLNDDFFWTPSATDWAYSTQWAGDQHPKYAPAHRYASFIIDGLNHHLTGFIDWNCVLDSIGGPNHVGNFCAAPFMVDYNNGVIYRTPIYDVLAQLSRSIRPGDRVLPISSTCATSNPNLHLLATLSPNGNVTLNILNTCNNAQYIKIHLSSKTKRLTIQPNGLTTILVL